MQGTARKDRHGKRLKAPPSNSLKPPKCLKLNRREMAIWREVVELLGTVPDLTADVDALAISCLCEAVAEVQDAREEIKKHGSTCESEKGGAYQHPAVGRKNKALERVRYWVARFGMTPSDRASLDVAAATAAEPTNPFQKLIAQQLN